MVWGLPLLLLLTACGLFGGTRPQAVEFASPDSASSAAVSVASIELESGHTRLANVGTFAIGEYGTKDLDVLQQSFAESMPAQAGASGHQVHVVVRRFLVSHSNNAGLAVACVAWALTDPDGALVFHEQFYASDSARIWGTIGKLKDHVHEGIVRRVLGSARAIAAGGERQSAPYTYDDYESATAQLPHSLRSVYLNAAMLGGGYALRISTVSGNSELGWARESDHLDWEAQLGGSTTAALE
ncbi:MAG: hypothetical protein K0V04_04490 [Deltaproteobacteria bacterium]|nr:hypothetical protein [Deltaproteobacteria bacterium]